MEVHWLEQTEADVPAQNDWLSASDAIHLDGLRFPKRHADWRLGRWTAKRAVALHLKLPCHSDALANIEIRPASDGAPEAYVAGRAAPVTISLSHRSGRAVCAVAPAGSALGCDLEAIEPRSAAFALDYFAPEEHILIEQAPGTDRWRLLALLWSAKESALKALRAGLRLDTRCVIVNLAGAPAGAGEDEPARGGWYPIQVCYDRHRVFHGWWQASDGMVRTVVVDPPALPPTLLIFP